MALAHTPQLLEKRLFNNKALSRNVNDFGQELSVSNYSLPANHNQPTHYES
ncbi:MAG: hypothetical protein NTW85_14075 [Methylococcales bacterium]|nr:hypothetical protein [Methylococcales bacterium]